jgi:hypothetical protein
MVLPYRITFQVWCKYVCMADIGKYIVCTGTAQKARERKNDVGHILLVKIP